MENSFSLNIWTDYKKPLYRCNRRTDTVAKLCKLTSVIALWTGNSLTNDQAKVMAAGKSCRLTKVLVVG